MPTFVVAPQWQGSGSSRAMRLLDGAAAIAGDLPQASTVTVDVPLEAGDDEGTLVRRVSSIALVRDRLTRTLAEVDGPAIVIGGDCGVELGAIPRALDREDAAVVWLDAHADLNTPESSPSRAFHGMVLRTLLGDGVPALVPSPPLAPSRLVLAGTRATDAAESEFLAASGVRVLPPEALDPDALVEAVAATGASSVYLHIDLDVLDPAEFAGIGFPEPFGLTVAGLVGLIRALRERFGFAGAGLCEFAPSSPAAAEDDLASILRIVGALAR
ncbi:arginase family protein [Herbiconiux sp. SYSU D00978]|uniref:arginase family protein n=1 Tax=Herbiconiux sp. SYSU D00978 TaxID=2812562 RepID=UPI001A9737A8|nr:arginase family protein [Herbiconiux sp. SYSU D00978]